MALIHLSCLATVRHINRDVINGIAGGVVSRLGQGLGVSPAWHEHYKSTLVHCDSESLTTIAFLWYDSLLLYPFSRRRSLFQGLL